MPCYYPISAYQLEAGSALVFANEKWGTTRRGGAYRQLQIACGQCSGCRLKRSRDWAIRCMHEKQMHRFSSYITLTLNTEHLPSDLSLDHSVFVKFTKRLRRLLEREWAHHSASTTNAQDRHQSANAVATVGPDIKQNRLPSLYADFVGIKPKLKFYMCGEYGPTHGRPHYHALLFGVDFRDKLYWRTTPAGAKIYRSATLERLWPYGYSSTGELTFQSAAYVARYVMKKRTGSGEKETEEILDLETGEIHKRKKEYNQMSRRSGIGSSWLEKYHQDVYSSKGKVIVRGHELNPPRYYDKLYEDVDELQLEHVKHQRYLEALAHHEHRTPERLSVQETVQAAKTKSLQRNALWE